MAMDHVPSLDDAARAELAAFWEVYQAEREGLDAALRDRLSEVPSLARAADEVDPELQARRNAESDREMHAALESGDFGPLVARLRAEAEGWAERGVPFADWHALLTLMRREVLKRLVDRAAGDAGTLNRLVAGLGHYLDLITEILGEAYLTAKERIITQQQAAIRELSTPVFRIRPRLLIVPVVGVVDTHRARQITESVLEAVRTHRARAAVIDITGVPMVDSRVAHHLVQTVEAAGLMGCEVLLTGISPGIARTVVALGADLGRVRTLVDLQAGVEAAEQRLAELGLPAEPGGGMMSPAPAGFAAEPVK